MTPSATCLPDLLRARCASDPDRVALVVDIGHKLTYDEWERRSNAAARGIAAAGVCRGDNVGLYFDNAHWTDYGVAYLAVQKAGAVGVPLSTRLTGAELSHILDHAGVGVVICPAGPTPPARADHLIDPRELEEGWNDEPFQVAIGPDDLADIVYTSGTTGLPKGVATSHGNLLAHDLPPEQGGIASFAHAFPVGTNAGQECLRMPLRRLTTAFVLASFDPERLVALVAEQRIRRLQLVPATARMVVEAVAAGGHDVSSVERITVSSAPAPPELWERLAQAFPGASLWNAYALTEGGGARTLMRHDGAHPGSVGRPVGATEVRVVDAEGADVTTGETGEIWLRRVGAPRRAYYRDPEATAAAFAGDWLRTGDLGYLDEEGYLYLVDRLKDVIISGGLNISSVEVENALQAHPAVVEAAAFGVSHPTLGQSVAAAVVLRTPVESRELQSFVRQRLGEHKVPRRVMVVDSLPRTDSGKVRKRELREQYGETAARTRPAVADRPRTHLEEGIVAVWQELLGQTDIGIHDDFFELGGHSLAATQVVVRVEDLYGVELPVTAVFDHPTVSELAGALSQALATAASR